MKTIFCLSFSVCSIAYSQRADFFKEDITFRLDGVHLDVEGYYWFANNSDDSIGSDIFYPFPQCAGGEIDSIRLYDISKGTKTFFRVDGSSGMSFYMSIAPHDTSLFQIGYRQKIVGDSATYILKTTQWWGKPLCHAEYKLMIPEALVLKTSTYPFTRFYKIGSEKIYYWGMSDFMPMRDMIFHFQ